MPTGQLFENVYVRTYTNTLGATVLLNNVVISGLR